MSATRPSWVIFPGSGIAGAGSRVAIQLKHVTAVVETGEIVTVHSVTGASYRVPVTFEEFLDKIESEDTKGG